MAPSAEHLTRDRRQRALDHGWCLLTGVEQAQSLARRLVCLLDAGH